MNYLKVEEVKIFWNIKVLKILISVSKAEWVNI